MIRELNNRRIFVTESACGIGRETALKLARCECDGRGRLADRFRQLAEEISALGRAVETVVGGITNPQAAAAACSLPAARGQAINRIEKIMPSLENVFASLTEVWGRVEQPRAEGTR